MKTKKTIALAITLFFNALAFSQVGIGTTSPSEILDIESSNATKTALDINCTGDGDPLIHFQIAGTAAFTIGVDNSDGDKFKIGTTAVETSTTLTIDGSQNVGINNSSPTYKLDLTGGSINLIPSALNTDFFRYNSVHALSMPSTNNLYVGEGAGAAFNAGGTDNTFLGYYAGNINSTGDYNVFVGKGAGALNTTGGQNVCVGKGAGASTGGVSDNVYIGHVAGQVEVTGIGNTMIGSTVGSTTTSSHNTFAGYMAGKFFTSGGDNICVGYQAGPTATNTTSNLLFIDNTANDSPLIWGDFSANEIVINGSGADDGGFAYEFFVNGDAGGNAAWNNLSDKRLKTKIETVKNPLEKLLALRGVNYNWIDTTKRGAQLELGFIAQEVLEVLPEVVNVPKDTATGNYSMAYAPITALLVEAMKEQQKMINEQQSEISAQKNQLLELKTLVDKLLLNQNKLEAQHKALTN